MILTREEAKEWQKLANVVSELLDRVGLTSVPVISSINCCDPGQRPTLTPATGAIKGTPASNNASVAPHAEAIDDEPLELRTSEVTRMTYGKSLGCGNAGKMLFSASAPCPIARRLVKAPDFDLMTPVDESGKS